LLRAQRILVVDDDEIILMMWHDALAKHEESWHVETATNGAQALAKFVRNPFDLIITDLRMPQMDGCRLTEAIRVLDKAVPVLWITAYPEPKTEVMARNLGVRRLLNKPVTVTEIRRAVSEVLEDRPSEY
jgi:CheY-like chemotaxis protein